MALPTDKILLRSPYWITKSDTNLSYISIALRIWTGALADEPSDLTISLRSTALNGLASIDIAELARDFVEVSFSDSGEESNAVLISQLTSSYYEDGTVSTDTKEYFLGLEAINNGLVDSLGGYDEVVEYLEQELNTTSINAARFTRPKTFFEKLSGVSKDTSYSVGRGIGDSFKTKKDTSVLPSLR